MLRFHTQTAGCTLTAQQPDNNIMRVTIQALAAVLGGTQSLHTNSRDEALALPTEESVRIALRTQQVIAYESGAADSIDPLAGSYLVESLTDQIEEQAAAYIRKSTISEAPPKRSAAASSRRKFRIRPTPIRSPWKRMSRSSSASTASPSRKIRPPDLLKVKPEVEIAQKQNPGPSQGQSRRRRWRRRLPAETSGPGQRQPHALTFLRPSRSTPPSARSPTPCATCSASIRRRSFCNAAGRSKRKGGAPGIFPRRPVGVLR
jgi:hypothetical protein